MSISTHNIKIVRYLPIFLVLCLPNLVVIFLLQHIPVWVNHISGVQKPPVPSACPVCSGLDALCTFCHFIFVNIIRWLPYYHRPLSNMKQPERGGDWPEVTQQVDGRTGKPAWLQSLCFYQRSAGLPPTRLVGQLSPRWSLWGSRTVSSFQGNSLL